MIEQNWRINLTIPQHTLRFIILAGIIMVSGCSGLSQQAACAVDLTSAVTIPYTITTQGGTMESTAFIGAVRDTSANQILIHFKDSGANGIESRITVEGSPADGSVLAYDHTASYPPDYEFPVQFNGTGSSGETGGIQSGSLTISRLTDDSISGVLDLTHYQAGANPELIIASFNDIALQSCP